MEFYKVLKQLRRQKDISQETLAEFLGISTQAVSKWECKLSYPDIELLPVLAEYFGVSIDFLLTGSQYPILSGFDSDCLADADTLYILQCKGNKILTKSIYDSNIRIMIKAEDVVSGSVEIWGSADIKGNIFGDVSTGSGVNCGNVSGDITAGGGVNCGNVTGDVSAGSGVNCGNVGKDVCNAGMEIHCGNIGGDITSTHGDIYCHEVKGSVNCAKTVYVK